MKLTNNYDHDIIAYLYDLEETQQDDIKLIKKLIISLGKLNILECFSGTGRILLSLAKEGHKVTGIELSEAMLKRASDKVRKYNKSINVKFIHGDVVNCDYGNQYDLVIMGNNAFYELSEPYMHIECIKKAYNCLNKGGYLFIDTNDYKGDWKSSDFGRENITFEGFDEDGNYGKMVRIDNSFDDKDNILYFTRILTIRDKTGNETKYEYIGQKHPVTKAEVEKALTTSHFNIISVFGDSNGGPYTKLSNHAIFFARKD